MDKNIDFDLLGVGTVLKRYRLEVPPNQREYSWRPDEQVLELLRDVERAMRGKSEPYFLGTIVLTKKGSETCEIADGQQRLATTTMILAVIRDWFITKGDTLMVENIDNDFLSKIDRKAGERVSRLSLNTDDDLFFRNAILTHSKERESMKPTRRSHNLIGDAKNTILDHFMTLEKQVGTRDFPDLLKQWIDYLESSATVLVLRVGDTANAFIMFETLNARGLETSQADLVKNYLFKESAERLGEAQSQWSTMRGAIETVAGEIDLTMDFLRLAGCVQCGPTRERDVMERISALAGNKTEAIRQLHFLAELAADYAAILNPAHPKWNDYGEETRKAIRTIHHLGVTQIRPLMLAVARHFKPADATKALRRMVAWSVRFLIVGGRGGKLDEGYANFANEIHKGKIRSANDLKNKAAGFVPTDGQFKGAFETCRVSVSKLARYYLRALEITARGQPDPEWVPNDDLEITLEHVMPESHSPDWSDVSQQDVETHSKRLGNLALLQAGKNSELGNKSFRLKCAVFKQSSFLLTSQIGDKKQWGAFDIETRQKKLAEFAVQTWPLD